MVVPNFLNPTLGNFDWACMPKMFSGCLADGGEMAIRSNMRLANVFIDDLDYVPPSEESDIIEAGVELDNIVGDGAEDLAKKWTGSEGFTQSPQGRLFVQMKRFLGPRGQLLLAEHMSSMPMYAGVGDDSDNYDENDEETRERTAKFLFASLSSCSSSVEKPRARAQSVPLRSPWSSPQLHTTPNRQGDKRWVRGITSPSSSENLSPFEKPRSSSHEISPPQERQNTSTRKTSRSIYDMIHFKKPSPSDGHRPLTTVFVQAPSSPGNNLASPFTTPSRIRRTAKSQVFISLPLASPSISPSPRPVFSSQLNISSPPGRSIQVPNDLQRSPQADLTGRLKRALSAAEIPYPSKLPKLDIEDSQEVTEYFRSSLYTPPQIVSSVQSGHPRENSADPSPLKSTAAIVPVLMPLAIAISEKQRRAATKAKQSEIQRKLLRALPKDQISSHALGKIKKCRLEMKRKRKGSSG